MLAASIVGCRVTHNRKNAMTAASNNTELALNFTCEFKIAFTLSLSLYQQQRALREDE